MNHSLKWTQPFFSSLPLLLSSPPSPSHLVQNMRVGDLILESPGHTHMGLWTDGTHHSISNTPLTTNSLHACSTFPIPLCKLKIEYRPTFDNGFGSSAKSHPIPAVLANFQALDTRNQKVKALTDLTIMQCLGTSILESLVGW